MGEWKEREEMKIYFSITFYVNPHPPCHSFSKFLLPSFSSPVVSNLNAPVTIRFFFIPWEIKGCGVGCQNVYVIKGRYLNSDFGVFPGAEVLETWRFLS